MRTPPAGLHEADLARLLRDRWALPVADLQHAPVGFGSHHWIATGTDGDRRFVTVDDLDTHGAEDVSAAFDRLRAAFTTAHALCATAHPSYVVAPLPTVDGALLARLGATRAASLFPFVPGRPWPEGDDSTPAARAAVVGLVARLHQASPAVRELARVDDLALPDRAHLERALSGSGQRWGPGPFAGPARALLAAHAEELQVALDAYDAMAGAVRARDEPWVVTHGEPKPDNVLDTDGGPVLIDWDTLLVAPAARDLWMVESGSGEELAAYAALTGRDVPLEDLTFYRLRWDLADLADYARWLSGPHERTADTEIAWRAVTETVHMARRWPALF